MTCCGPDKCFLTFNDPTGQPRNAWDLCNIVLKEVLVTMSTAGILRAAEVLPKLAGNRLITDNYCLPTNIKQITNQCPIS